MKSLNLFTTKKSSIRRYRPRHFFRICCFAIFWGFSKIQRSRLLRNTIITPPHVTKAMRQSSANLKALRDVCNVCFIIICILIYCFLRNVHKDIKRCVIGVYDSRGGGWKSCGEFSRRLSMWCATKLRLYLSIVKRNGVKIVLKEPFPFKLSSAFAFSAG